MAVSPVLVAGAQRAGGVHRSGRGRSARLGRPFERSWRWPTAIWRRSSCWLSKPMRPRTWATKAITLARELDDQNTLAHALNNLGSTRLRLGDHAGFALLEESLEIAVRETVRRPRRPRVRQSRLDRLDYRQYDKAERYIEEGLAYAEKQGARREHLLHNGGSAPGWASSAADGRQAERDARWVLSQPEEPGITNMPALADAGSAARSPWRSGRRSDDRTKPGKLVEPTGELQRIAPVAVARSELAWLRDDAGGHQHCDHRRVPTRDGGATAVDHRRTRVLDVARRPASCDTLAGPETPYALQMAGRWREAAAQRTANSSGKAAASRRPGRGSESTLVPHHDVIECFAFQLRHDRTGLRVADREENERALVVRPIQQRRKKRHRAGSVRQGCEPHVVKCSDEHAGCDADRLLHVVVLGAFAVGLDAEALLEQHHDPRCTFEIGLLPRCAEPGDLVLPIVRHPTVEVVRALLFFCCQPDAPLGGRVADEHERPRLLMGPGRCRPGRLDRQLDQIPRDCLVAERADRAPSRHEVVERRGAIPHLALGVARTLVFCEVLAVAVRVVVVAHSALPTVRARFPRGDDDGRSG